MDKCTFNANTQWRVEALKHELKLGVIAQNTELIRGKEGGKMEQPNETGKSRGNQKTAKGMKQNPEREMRLVKPLSTFLSLSLSLSLSLCFNEVSHYNHQLCGFSVRNMFTKRQKTESDSEGWWVVGQSY